jgi:hypothetical protein
MGLTRDLNQPYPHQSRGINPKTSTTLGTLSKGYPIACKLNHKPDGAEHYRLLTSAIGY